MDQRAFVKTMQRLYPSTPRDDAYKIFAMVVETLREVLRQGESIQLPGLGSFFPVFIERSREWKNPETGKVILLGNKVRLRFRISRGFETIMNEQLMNAESLAKMKTYSAVCCDDQLEDDDV